MNEPRRKPTDQEMTDFCYIRDRMSHQFGIDATHAAFELFEYERIHGENAITALAECYRDDVGENPGRAGATLGHDINGFRESCFCPRSLDWWESKQKIDAAAGMNGQRRPLTDERARPPGKKPGTARPFTRRDDGRRPKTLGENPRSRTCST